MPFNNIVSRADAAADIPQVVASQIVGAVEEQSMSLRLGRRLPVSTRDSRVPVLTAVPDAYWVSPVDTGLKQTSEFAFTNQELTAEEIAVLVPCPVSVVDDADYDLWGALRPLLGRAFAAKLDRAVLFGQDSPASWGDGLVERATTAGQTMVASSGTGADYARDLLLAAAMVATEARRSPTAAAVRPGWEFVAGAQRTNALESGPISAARPFPLSISGMPIGTAPVYWDGAVADAIVADWQSVLIGVRQDIRFEIFDTGVIQNADGTIAFNLMQQDLYAMRATMRVGYLLATPATQTGDQAVPVSVVTPAP